MHKVTLGTDPELFAIDKRGRYGRVNRLVPGYYALGGDIDYDLPHGTLVPDGAAIEFTLHPTASVDVFMDRMRDNIRAIHRIVDRNGLALSCQPMIEVSQRYIHDLGDAHSNRTTLQRFGCNPDLVVWDGREQERPDPKKFFKRSSGGHLHFSLDPQFADDWPCLATLVGGLDQFLGTADAFLTDNAYAMDRKKLYGRAGTIRMPKEVAPGVKVMEYRSMASQTVTHVPDVTRLIMEGAQRLVQWTQDLFIEGAQRDPDKATQLMGQVFGSYEYMSSVAKAIDAKAIPTCRSIIVALGYNMPEETGLRNIISELVGQQLPSDNFEVNW